jgi:autonomous glycyl radical cofactor GrcA
MKKYEPFYSGVLSIRNDIREIEIFSEYIEDILSLEEQIDRIEYIMKKIRIAKHPKIYSNLNTKKTERKMVLNALYRRVAGYAVWLRSEHIKQQCEVIKKINES